MLLHLTARGGLAQYRLMVSLYHSLEENEASRVGSDGKSCVFLVVDPRWWMDCTTNNVTCACGQITLATHDPPAAGVRWTRC
jgi:hypothetical protein